VPPVVVSGGDGDGGDVVVAPSSSGMTNCAEAIGMPLFVLDKNNDSAPMAMAAIARQRPAACFILLSRSLLLCPIFFMMSRVFVKLILIVRHKSELQNRSAITHKLLLWMPDEHLL
jgi:hypothetical protein